MALQVWLPLNKSGADKNQGLANINIVNNARYEASGKLGGCYKNGTINSGWGKDYNACLGLSASCWINIPTVEGNAIILGSVHNYPANTRFYVGCYNGYFSGGFGNTGWGDAASNRKIESGTWYHLCMTTFGTNWKLYINGQCVQEKISSANPVILYGNIYIGEKQALYSDFRIYDHCLSPKEVKEIAKGLVLHYPLNDAYVEGTVNLGNTSSSYSNMTDGYEFSASSWGGDAGTVTYYKSGGYNNLPYKVYHKTASGSGGICYKTANDISIVAGKTYTMSVWVKASRNFLGSSYSFNINGVTSSDSNHYITYSKQFPFTTEWTRISRTFTATESDAGMYGEMSIIYDNVDTDYYVYFSGFQIEEKDHATPYTSNTRNETTVYDCSGYQNNGTVEEFKAAGNNLVTGLTAGGQTTVSGETVTTSGVNADTYFSINLSESIVVGQTYTLSCIGENIPTDGYFGFPLGWQGNTSLMFNIKNGYNEITFTANDGSWGTNRLFMDDMGRDTAYMNQCKFTNFKLYKHSIINSGLNAVFDSPRYKIGAKFNGQHSIWLSSPLGSGAKEELTVSFWHKPNSQGNYRTIVSNNNPHSGFWIGCNCEGYGLWYYGNGFYVRSQSPLSNDIWYHCALTYKNQTYQWYLNGVLVTTSTSGTFKAPTFSSSISIGGNTSGDMKGSSNDYRQYGALSDFRIYSTALSEEDIKELYNTSAYVLDNGTLLTYNLEE